MGVRHGSQTQDAARDDAAVRRELLLAMESYEVELLDLWWELGPDGPTCGSASTGPRDAATARYLLPLARTLRGALQGSAEHRAVYLDERTRYSDPRFDLRRALDVELPALGRLLLPSAVDAAVAVLEEVHAPLVGEAPSGPRVLFVGDCLFVEIRAFLRAGHPDPRTAPVTEHVFFSAHQGIDDVESATATAVREFAPAVVGLSLFTFDATPLFKAALHDNALPRFAPDLSLVPTMVEMLRAEIAGIRAVTDATIVVHAPSGIPLDRFRRRLPGFVPPHSRAQRAMLATLRDEIRALVDATENAVLLDEDAAIGGRTREHAKPLFAPTDVPDGYFHTTRLGPALAETYSRVVDVVDLLGGAKALFVDFDNTLWRGVMAEGAVTHDRTAQRLLKELKEAGVLLVALSKNDASAIRWDELDLDPDDFVLHKIDWTPKPQNALAAIAELDLAPQAFVLLDDNPVERALVTEGVPGVRALDPLDPQTWQTLRTWLALPSTKQTAEAAKRTEMYRQAAERKASVAGSADHPTMMASLDLRSAVRPARAADMERLLELVQRTNQFNTTTRRRSADELRRMLDDDRWGVWIATLADRFGDLGVVAVAFFERTDRVVDSFVMSCRAMGFGLETAFLAAVVAQESVRDASPVRALFVPSERNRPAASLFRDRGFVEESDGVWLLADPRDVTPAPEWLTVKIEAPSAALS